MQIRSLFSSLRSRSLRCQRPGTRSVGSMTPSTEDPNNELFRYTSGRWIYASIFLSGRGSKLMFVVSTKIYGCRNATSSSMFLPSKTPLPLRLVTHNPTSSPSLNWQKVGSTGSSKPISVTGDLLSQDYRIRPQRPHTILSRARQPLWIIFGYMDFKPLRCMRGVRKERTPSALSI